MFTAKDGALVKASKDMAARPRQNCTSGGSSDTDEKEFTVTPMGSPSGAMVVTTEMPVAKHPRALRNARESKVMAACFRLDGTAVQAGLTQPAFRRKPELSGFDSKHASFR